MKRSKVILVLLYTILLTGCGTDSNGTDPRIGSIYESDKANGGTLNYDSWLEFRCCA